MAVFHLNYFFFVVRRTRTIVLKFHLTNRVLTKKLFLPLHDPKVSDVAVLKEMLLNEITSKTCQKCLKTFRLLGGNARTTIDHISILKYGEEGVLKDVPMDAIFGEIERDVFVKLEKTDDDVMDSSETDQENTGLTSLVITDGNYSLNF